MKTRGMAFLILAGCLMAGAAAAQMATGLNGGASKGGQADKGTMDGEMMKKCEAMMAEREGMMSKMKAMDEKLDHRVVEMDAADGDRKVAAMREVIRELVAQRKTMREMSMKMESLMSWHMMEHMRSGNVASMAMCPMTKHVAAETPKPAKTGEADHANHH